MAQYDKKIDNNNPRSFFKEKVGGLSSISVSVQDTFLLLAGGG